ncbi:MAG: toprim domain-containing protein [Alphaproteobacteria bacterium]|nr:toprim domain-containing protein [Alphaproteobacteria bacterium]
MSRSISASEIAQMLASRIEMLCHELLPGGVREGVEWRVGSCAGEKGKSMAVRIKGSRLGVWSDFSSGEKGDALDLVAAVLFRGSKKDALSWSKSWLGIDTLDHSRLEQRRREVKVEADKKSKDAAEEAKKKRTVARKMWLEAESDILKTPVHLYLLGREIDIRTLPKLPRALRYAMTYCAEKKTDLPTMLAAVIDGKGKQIATHRTWLSDQPDGKWKKADLVTSKKVLGGFVSGIIPLNRGASGKSLQKAPEGDHIIIAEGIETALSLAVCCPEKRVIAAVAVNNIANLDLPKTISQVTLAVDNDGENAQSGKAVNAAITRFMNEGRVVSVARSPVGSDFNDQLQEI